MKYFKELIPSLLFAVVFVISTLICRVDTDELIKDVQAKEINSPDTSNVSTTCGDFIQIKDNLYYDPATNIVYMRQTTYMLHYIYNEYTAPDRLPYKYDPDTGKFHMETESK